MWVSPSTVRRVLAAHGLILRAPRRAGRSERRPFPEWASYARNSIWIYDCTHFARCPGVAVTTIDGPRHAQVDLRGRLGRGDQHPGRGRVHRRARSSRDCSSSSRPARTASLTRRRIPLDDAVAGPILLAVSDNGPQMTSGSTREFMAMCAIAQHFGRPGTPTDQAWIESLFSHLKAEWPHLDHIPTPPTLRAELARRPRRVQHRPLARRDRLRHPRRRTRRARTRDPKGPPSGPAPRPPAADRVPSITTQSTPTARAPGCGLIDSPIRRVESETPQSGIAGRLGAGSLRRGLGARIGV